MLAMAVFGLWASAFARQTSERRPGAPLGRLLESGLIGLSQHPRLSKSIRSFCCEIGVYHGCMPHVEHQPTAALSSARLGFR